MSNPIVILGNPRSGTSLTRSILNSHPEIYIAPECGFAQYLYDGNIIDNITKQELADNIVNAKKFEFWGLSKFEVLQLIETTWPNYISLIREIYLYKASKEDKCNLKYWGDKNNYYIKHLDILPDLFPNAFYLHVVRDGRDVATSYKKLSKSNEQVKYQPNLTGNVESIANEWAENNMNISRFFENNKAFNYIFVKYEDLVLNYDKTINEVSEFLTIDSTLFMNPNEKLRNDEPSVYWWKSDLNNRIESKNINKYLDVLSIDEIKSFNKIASKTLLKYNY